VSLEKVASGTEPNSVVFDSSAVLALIYGEAGAEVVESYLPGGFISAVNLSEVAVVAVREGADLEATKTQLARLPLKVISFTGEHAYLTASLASFTKTHNLSLGDRCCLALAMSVRSPVLTTERNWAELAVPLEVRLIR
jgi:ribonuclease VapC